MEESVEKQRKRRTTAGENGEKIRRAEREKRRDLVRAERSETAGGKFDRELREVGGTSGRRRRKGGAFVWTRAFDREE